MENATLLHFEPSERISRTKCLLVTIVDDSGLDAEPVKFFRVLLATSDEAVNITNDVAMVTVWDDDTVFVSLVEVDEDAPEGVGNVSVCAILTGVIERAVEVTLSTAPGTAQG